MNVTRTLLTGRRLLAVGALALGAMVLPATSGVQADTLANSTTPVSAEMYNGCTGENVAISGVMHIMLHVTQSASGTVHVDNFVDAHGSGAGETSGTSYQFGSSSNFSYNTGSPFPWNNTYVLTERLVGQGPNNNMVFHLTLHVTVNANGALTSNVVQATADSCH